MYIVYSKSLRGRHLRKKRKENSKWHRRVIARLPALVMFFLSSCFFNFFFNFFYNFFFFFFFCICFFYIFLSFSFFLFF